jgi:dTDP-4-amino-4,6-dideoxygalactose transaminase
MDVTIDPSGQLKLCRWQSNAVGIGSSDDVSTSVDLLRWLKRQDGQGCPLGLPVEAGESSPYEFQPASVWPVITEAHHRAVDLQLRNQAVSYFGREGTVARFENEFAAAVGSADALALASGTVAVYLACHALDLTHGAEVIVPSITYPGVVAAILWAGARIAVCDVDRVTGNIDVDAMLQAITGDTRAVVVTHLWGVPADIERLVAVCRLRGIRVIEDASHAYGASVGGVPVGSFGDAGCFSLQANKIVFAGEGGVFVARDRDVFERAAALASLGPRFHDTVRTAALSSYEGTGAGLKLKIHPLGAALALASLREGRAVLAARAERMNIVNAEIEHIDGILLPLMALRNERAYYAYRLALTNELIDQRPRFVDALLRAGLDVRLPDWDLVSDLPLVRDSDRARTSPLPNARLLVRSQFGLPTFTAEPLDLVRRYARTLRELASEVLRPSTARSGDVRGIT